MDIFSYFQKKGIDTVDASFTERSMNGKAGMTPVSKTFPSIECILGRGPITGENARAWGWQRNCQKTSQTYF